MIEKFSANTGKFQPKTEKTNPVAELETAMKEGGIGISHDSRLLPHALCFTIF